MASKKQEKQETTKRKEYEDSMLQEIREDISKIKVDLAEIKKILAQIREEPPITIRLADAKEVLFEEAKIKVENFLQECFKKQETVYPSDVADELGLDYELVRNIIDMLIKEEKLEKDEGGD